MKLESGLRRIVGLPAEPPDPVGMMFVPDEDGKPFSTIKFLPEDEVAKNKQAWHHEPWRARAIDRLTRSQYAIKRAWERVEAERYHRVASYMLNHRRTLTFTSHYLNDRWAVEGYFDFGKYAFGLTVYAAGAIDRYIQAELKYKHHETGHVMSSDSPFGYTAWVVSPAEELDNAAVLTAITAWYEDRYNWKQGHWSQKGDKPEITLNIEWEKKNAG